MFLAPNRNSRFLISDMHVQNKKYRDFVSISRLTGKCAGDVPKPNGTAHGDSRAETNLLS